MIVYFSWTFVWSSNTIHYTQLHNTGRGECLHPPLQCCSAAVSRCPTCRSGAPSTQPPLQQPIRKRVWSIFLEVSFYPLHIQYSQCQFACTEVVRCYGAWCSNVLPGDNSRSFSDPYHLSPIQARFLISFKWCSFKLATSSCARWGNHRQRVSHLRHVTWLLLTCHASRYQWSVVSSARSHETSSQNLRWATFLIILLLLVSASRGVPSSIFSTLPLGTSLKKSVLSRFDTIS